MEHMKYEPLKENKLIFSQVFVIKLDDFLNNYIKRFSDYSLLVKHITILKKFLFFLKCKTFSKEKYKTLFQKVSFISSSDLQIASSVLFRQEQKDFYSKELLYY